MSFEFERQQRAEFIDKLRDLNQAGGVLDGFFDAVNPIGIARAPGRLDVMGGIADYSGSLVLQYPIREAAFAAVQLNRSADVRAVSIGPLPGAIRDVTYSSREMAGIVTDRDWDKARAWLTGSPEHGWARYVVGTLLGTMLEGWISAGCGARILIASDVPEGAGVSSSAAIEVATLLAAMASTGKAHGSKFDRGYEAALICQRVENSIVGAPCGVMDQMASACGRSGELLELLCQPATLLGTRSLPEGLRLYGIESGVRHEVSGAEYGQVRTAAFMGYRLLLKAAGIEVQKGLVSGKVTVQDSRWRGAVANVTPAELAGEFSSVLPVEMSGLEFLERFGGITDPVTDVRTDRSYPVREATRHPIEEHHRVQIFAELLNAPLSERGARLLGELMYQSHESYSACGLGSAATDRLVKLVRAEGIAAGLYGAKITGGGSGGTVAILARRGAAGAIAAIAQRYAEMTGRSARVFSGSSAGAEEFGVHVVPAAALGA